MRGVCVWMWCVCMVCVWCVRVLCVGVLLFVCVWRGWGGECLCGVWCVCLRFVSGVCLLCGVCEMVCECGVCVL